MRPCQAAARFALLSLVASKWLSSAENELELQARLTPCELVRYFGYPCEVSYATTEDGYILEVDRVPHGRNGTTGQNGTARHPILFLPAILTASDIWFLNYPDQSPGFEAADAGFDVWTMNSRDADRYASHTTLSKNDPKYSKWSFDEIGRYDVAAGIDHVLNATGAPKLILFSLSQGVTATLVLLSTRPEYNNKVDLVVAYGPVANVSHFGPPLSLLIPFVPEIAVVAYPFTRAGYLGVDQGGSELLAGLCNLITGQICSVVITIPAFTSPYQLNETRLPVYAGHYPIGTSLQNLLHYNQMYRAKNFIMYDYGSAENRRRYNQTTPPAYPLERITSPVALFSSTGDTFADPTDVKLLASRLGSRVILNRVVPQQTFRHFDFVVGYRANDFLHNVAIDLVRQYAG
ncbi:lipase member N-like [Amblyomma americanum]